MGLVASLAVRSHQYRKAKLARQASSRLIERKAAAIELYAVNDQEDDRLGIGKALQAVNQEIACLQQHASETPPHLATLLNAINGWFYTRAQRAYRRTVSARR
jgi:hypothetical protein